MTAQRPSSPSPVTRRTALLWFATAGAGVALAACGGSATATTSATAGSTSAAPATSAAASPASTSAATTSAASSAAASAATTTSAAASSSQASAASSASSAASTSVASAAAASAPAKLAGTLQVWGGVPAENGPQDLVNAFMQEQPGVKVTYTRFVNDDTGNVKLDTALQAGDQIDVYFSYDVPRMSQRIKAGAAEDLDSYVSKTGGAIQQFAGSDGIFKLDGKLYSLPTTPETNYLMVDKELIDAAGVTIPDTWDQTAFRAALQKIAASAKGGKPLYGIFQAPDFAREKLGPNYWYTDGGKSANFDNPAFKQSWEYMHTLIFDDKSEFPWKDVLAQNLRAYPQNTFLTQQVATMVSAPWMLRYVNDTKQYPHSWVTTFAPLPAPDGVANPYNPGSLDNWILLSPNTKAKDAGWGFIAYWLTGGAKYMLKGGKVPAVLQGQNLDDITAGILGPNRDQLFDVAAFKKYGLPTNARYVIDTITTGSAEIQKDVQAQTDRYFIGEITIDQLISTVQQQANAAIQKGS